jgi:TfoX/Sxy family transcriptional regulator of competence genes
MAYDEYLADRIRRTLVHKRVQFLEKKMMGGLTFMVDEKMCIGIIKNDLMARIDPDILQIALSKNGCREMDFTGKSMKGFVLVEPHGMDSDIDLDYWIKLCLDFNPKAKSSKKK